VQHGVVSFLCTRGPVREWRMISIQQEKREKASPGYGVRSSTVSVLLCWRTASDCHTECLFPRYVEVRTKSLRDVQPVYPRRPTGRGFVPSFGPANTDTSSTKWNLECPDSNLKHRYHDANRSEAPPITASLSLFVLYPNLSVVQGNCWEIAK
jgi:hypothetical protein